LDRVSIFVRACVADNAENCIEKSSKKSDFPSMEKTMPRRQKGF